MRISIKKVSKSTPSDLNYTLGGASFLDHPSFAILAFVSFTVSLSLSDGFDSINSFTSWALVHGLSLVFCVGWFLIGSSFMFRHRALKPVPIYGVLFFGFVLGLIKGGSTGLLAIAIGLEIGDFYLTITRMVAAGLAGLLIVPCMSFLEYKRRQFQRDFEQLAAERITLELHLDSPQRRSQVEIGNIRETLADLSSSISRLSQTPGGVSESITLLRAVVDEIVRPTSHRLWEKQLDSLDNFNFTSLIKLSLTGKQFSLGYFALIFLPMVWLSYAQSFSMQESLTRTLLTAISIFVFLVFCKLVKVKGSLGNALLEFFLIVLGSLVAINLNNLIFQEVFNLSDLATVFALLIWVLELRIFLGAVFVANSRHDQIRKLLDELYGKDQSHQKFDLVRKQFENRELANFLHGKVQNQILATTLKLEEGQGTIKQVLTEINELMHLLSKEFGETHAQKSKESDQRRFSEISKLWSGFVNIKFDCRLSDLMEIGLEVSQLEQILEEAVSNAVRHGFADEVRVSVAQLSASTAQLVILDNGIGPTSGKPGLGTALMNSIAGSNWTLASNETGGSKLTLDLPVRSGSK